MALATLMQKLDKDAEKMRSLEPSITRLVRVAGPPAAFSKAQAQSLAQHHERLQRATAEVRRHKPSSRAVRR